MAVNENGPLDKYCYPWMDVAEFMRWSIHNGTWQRKFHMSPEAFDYLVDVIRDDVGVDKWHSKCGSGGNDPIIPEMSVMMGLRFMGEEIRKTIEDFAGISPNSCVRHCFNFLDAVDGCSDPLLSINCLPKTKEEYTKLADGWSELSGVYNIFY